MKNQIRFFDSIIFVCSNLKGAKNENSGYAIAVIGQKPQQIALVDFSPASFGTSGNPANHF